MNEPMTERENPDWKLFFSEELNDFFGTTPQELINYFGTIFFCEEHTEITWIDGPKPGYRMTTYKMPKTSATQENSCTQDNSSDSASISSVPPPQTDPPH
jgi:hypothetical protein